MTLLLTDRLVVETARKTLLTYRLCDCCLGRLFADVETGLTNLERGRIIRGGIDAEVEEVECEDCWLCSGLFNEVDHFADLVVNSLKGYEFDTFLVGSKVDEDILEKESELLGFSSFFRPEPVKRNLNREIGKIVGEKLRKDVDLSDPTIAAVVDTVFDVVDLQIKPLYVYGRYRKYKRGIPQTKWFCRTCRGQGCEKCGFTGKMYETSVEELISEEFMVLTGGESESFHGCGREDIDARMLGNGRPFVLEIKNPRVRKLNLSEIESRINSRYDEVKVESLRFSNREEVLRIKNARFRKTYRVVIECEKTLNNQKLKKVALCLQGKTIKQITPSRVAHRRAVKTRLRKIYYCGVDSVTGSSATMTIEAESGTYIKELVSGDDGRTKPSVTELIGTPCRVVKLDVIKVEGE